MDSLHTGEGFKIIYMRKGPMKKILEKMLTDYRQKGKGYKTIYFIIIALLWERIQRSIFLGHERIILDLDTFLKFQKHSIYSLIGNVSF